MVAKSVPMTCECKLDNFYVRYYSVQYKQIKELLGKRRKDWISMAGTPGIDKSVFYLYEFNRYRQNFRTDGYLSNMLMFL